MRKSIGWAICAAGFVIWLFGYLSAGHASLIDWLATTPWWISSFVPNLEAKIGLFYLSRPVESLGGAPCGSRPRSIRRNGERERSPWAMLNCSETSQAGAGTQRSIADSRRRCCMVQNEHILETGAGCSRIRGNASDGVPAEQAATLAEARGNIASGGISVAA
jgi:hypothetical protein